MISKHLDALTICPFKSLGGQEGKGVQIPWCSHLTPGEESPTETSFPQEVKTRSPPSSPAHQLLPVSHSEQPDLLLHCVVLTGGDGS